MIKAYVSQIAALKPEGTGCIYKTSVWKNLSVAHKALVCDYEDKDVTRADVLKAYQSYYDGNDDYLRAFLLTMIWGFEYTGYGTFRTNNYITNPENAEIIRTALEAVGQYEVEKAFRALKRIKGLGISYISKVLFFATKAKEISAYCLVFDIRVARSLVMLSAPAYVNDIITVMPSDKWKDYRKYNELMYKLAEQYQLSAESIELFLFEQEF